MPSPILLSIGRDAKFFFSLGNEKRNFMEKDEQKLNLRREPCGCKSWEQPGAKKGSFEEHVEFCEEHDPEFGDDKPVRPLKTPAR